MKKDMFLRIFLGGCPLLLLLLDFRVEDEQKALQKSGGKDNDDKQFPHAACIIDVTRCTVAFANAEDLMEGFEHVMSGACQEEFGCRFDLKSSLRSV